MSVATVGRKPKPTLAVVREGNPGHRPVKDSVTLPPSALLEPKWSEVFPGPRRSELRARKTAAAMWLKLAPTLHRSVGLVGEQQETLVDLCITWARIEQGERAISLDGMVVDGARGGLVKNPWTTVLNQYRSHFRSLVGELGLTPSAATRLGGRGGGDDDDEDGIFD